MKLMHGLMIVTVTGSMLWAQSPAPAKPAAQAAKPAATPTSTKPAQATKPTTTQNAKAPVSAAKPPVIQAKPASGPAAKPTTPAAPKPAPVQAAKPVKAQPVAAKPAVVDKPAAAEKKGSPVAANASKPATASAPASPAKPAMVKEETRVSAAQGNRRDPFVSPIVRASGGGAPCETGKRCLMVDQIQLKGIVKSPNGYIAVVENAARRAYFLRENDPVFNGSVVKITGDTVIFREQVIDKLGKQNMREVTKKVNAPVV